MENTRKIEIIDELIYRIYLQESSYFICNILDEILYKGIIDKSEYYYIGDDLKDQFSKFDTIYKNYTSHINFLGKRPYRASCALWTYNELDERIRFLNDWKNNIL